MCSGEPRTFDLVLSDDNFVNVVYILSPLGKILSFLSSVTSTYLTKTLVSSLVAQNEIMLVFENSWILTGLSIYLILPMLKRCGHELYLVKTQVVR